MTPASGTGTTLSGQSSDAAFLRDFWASLVFTLWFAFFAFLIGVFVWLAVTA